MKPGGQLLDKKQAGHEETDFLNMKRKLAILLLGLQDKIKARGEMH